MLDGGSAADFARLHRRLADWACDAVQLALDAGHGRASDLAFIAFHGQTIWHEPPSVTWQLGEAALLAERFGVRVVSNFRARDVAAGGQGAPLVPVADVLLFGAPDAPRVLLNLGGMANLTYVERRAQERGAFAFDTGPGVAVVDAVARLVQPGAPVRSRRRARGAGDARTSGARRAAGRSVLRRGAAQEHRSRAVRRRVRGVAAPARAGPGRRGDGGRADRALHRPGDRRVGPPGARGRGVRRRRAPSRPHGGARARPHADGRSPRLRRFDDLFFPGDAKEAVAFALLGYLTLHGQPGNLVAATGAAGPRVLGTVTPA